MPSLTGVPIDQLNAASTITGREIFPITVNSLTYNTTISSIFYNNSVKTSAISSLAVTTAKINDSAVTTAKIADSNVTTAKIANSNVTTAKIADSNVTTAKIADSNVTTAKIADSNVTTVKINDSAVTTDKIADNAITSDKIASNAVGSAEIAASAVGNVEIADNAVNTSKIADSSVTTSKIINNAVTESKIADNAVTSSKIATGAVGNSEIAAGSITSDKIGMGGPSWFGGVTSFYGSGNNGGIELNANAAGNGTCYIDFHTKNGGDYDARIFRNSGAGGTLTFNNLGGNGIDFLIDSTSKLYIHGSGANVAGTVTATAFTGPLNGTATGNIKQGGGGSQTGNTIYMGWSGAGKLRVQVDVTDFGSTWPIDITGNSSYATNAGSSNTANIANTVIDNAITTSKIADNSVTTSKIVNNAVTESKIVNSAVTSSKIATGAVGNSEIAAGSITSDKIGTGGPSWGGGTFSTNTQAGLELGPNIAADTNSYIDFHSAPGGDYDARVWRRPGVNGNLDIYNSGTGAIWLNQIGSGSVNFATNNVSRVTIDQNGLTTLNKNVTINGDVNANDTIYANNYVWLSDDPVNNRHATTKLYVDSRIPNYSFTSGQNYVYDFSNVIGQFRDNKNFFDVYPPYGKTMANLAAFISSIHVIHFAGDVNGDDSLRCYWVYHNGSINWPTDGSANRVRVYVQNTEQRSAPATNWLAVWS